MLTTSVKVNSYYMSPSIGANMYTDLFGDKEIGFATINNTIAVKFIKNGTPNINKLTVSSVFAKKNNITNTATITKLDDSEVISVGCIYLEMANNDKLLSMNILSKLFVKDGKIYVTDKMIDNEVELQAIGNYFNNQFIATDDINKFINDNQNKYFAIQKVGLSYLPIMQKINDFKNNPTPMPQHMNIEYGVNKKRVCCISTQTFNTIKERYPNIIHNNKVTTQFNNVNADAKYLLTEDELQRYSIIYHTNAFKTFEINDTVTYDRKTTIIISSKHVNIISLEYFEYDKPRKTNNIESVHQTYIPLVLIDDQGEMYTNFKQENNTFKVNNIHMSNNNYISNYLTTKYSDAKLIEKDTHYNINDCIKTRNTIPIYEYNKVINSITNFKSKLAISNIFSIIDDTDLYNLASYIIGKQTSISHSVETLNKYNDDNPNFILPYNKEYAQRSNITVNISTSLNAVNASEQIVNISDILIQQDANIKIEDNNPSVVLSLVINKEYVKSFFTNKVVLKRTLECNTEYLASSIIKNNAYDFDKVLLEIVKRAPIIDDMILATDDIIDEVFTTN